MRYLSVQAEAAWSSSQHLADLVLLSPTQSHQPIALAVPSSGDATSSGDRHWKRLSGELAARILADQSADIVDVGGVGGTLAGNALSVAATRATLEHVLTDAAFTSMIAVADRYTAGVQAVLDSRDLPWSITRLGARAEYRFCPQPPRSGGESGCRRGPGAG